MLLTIFSLVVVLGVLISVHEFGHFIVAKAVGIQVLRFSLGFGRPVIAWRRGETEYWISWIPLGGYVKMAGLEDEGMAGELEGGKAAVPIDPARAFDQKPLWARMAVILAGVTMNVILAFVIYTGLGIAVGNPMRPTTQVDTVLVNRLPRGTESLATLQRGDRIVRIDGDTVRTWEDVQSHLLIGAGVARLELAGRKDPIRITIPRDENARLSLALWDLEPLFPARIGKVLTNEPAAHAGLQRGDVIVRADNDTIRSWSDLIHKLWLNPGRSITIRVLRGDSIVQLSVTPRAETESDSLSSRPKTYGYIGAEADFVVNRRVSIGGAVRYGALQTVGTIGIMLESLKRLVLGRASVREVGGPITIARVSGQAARLGLVQFLRFLAFFSVSLAVLNLLPIPVLDGGHAMFLIAEGIRRKPLSARLRLRLTQFGMLVVLAIMVVAIGNDVLRLFR
ncbi:MAG TPA: RIP metalloprotease RseP [Gemmatimonadales bacterium]|nr:RIP metalloprotease RseP [Gemmatimonadales bacterium]